MPYEAARIERRTLERTASVDEVLAPASWTDARVEAWLDWLEGDSDLPAAVPNRTDRTLANPDPETVIRSPPESGPADWLSRLSTGAVVVADAAGAPTTAQARAASRVADK